jgi:hypothetical protein
MTMEASIDDVSGSDRRELRLAELVALGLLVIEGLVILGYVAAGIANQAQLGGSFSVEGAHAWGFTLVRASAWSAPWAVAVFLLGPLGLVAWIERQEGDDVSAARTGLVLRLELVLAVLTIAAGVIAIVGRAMQVSPSQQWSGFLESLGTGVGSVCLGVLALVVVRWLADDARVGLLGRRPQP